MGHPLAPGTPEHMYQRWLDYQFRYPGKRGTLSLVVDPEWKRLYHTVMKNAEAGGAFQRDALAALKLKKNTALMMPPPGSQKVAFIPDAVKGSPDALIWGQAYDFVEAKGRKELSLGGNLKAMLEYVAAVKDAKLVLVVRSAKHPEGATKLSRNLMDAINKLGGRVEIRRLPE